MGVYVLEMPLLHKVTELYSRASSPSSVGGRKSIMSSDSKCEIQRASVMQNPPSALTSIPSNSEQVYMQRVTVPSASHKNSLRELWPTTACFLKHHSLCSPPTRRETPPITASAAVGGTLPRRGRSYTPARAPSCRASSRPAGSAGGSSSAGRAGRAIWRICTTVSKVGDRRRRRGTNAR